MSTGFKQNVENDFQNLGFKIFHMRFFGPPTYKFFGFFTGCFVAEPNRGKIDELEDLDHDLDPRKNG